LCLSEIIQPMQKHILIVEDEQDTFENLERKIKTNFSDALVKVQSNCDVGFDYIKKSKITTPVSILVLDLTFKNQKPSDVLKGGKDLLKELKKEAIKVPTILYTSHDEMEHIHPIINNYQPSGYVIKSATSSEELLFAINRVLLGETYFSQRVHEQQSQRFKYASKIDEIDEQILQFLPDANSIKDWEGKVLKENVPLSHKSIKKRIDLLCDRLEVDNEKQLLLKLQRLAVL